ncbi:MAG: hypothetical protein K2L35_05195 [Muribaculaceae bacterium]|nr:hypothetical protein [Muribaculaceae bacterium]MDE6447694.1 hypothetical protein [Muribaculaceae bacterium]
MKKIMTLLWLLAVALLPAVAQEPAEAGAPEGEREGGRMVWVPDSMATEVATLLKGHSRVVDDPLRLDVNEKTVWRGDTIPMVLRSPNLGRYDRGLFNFLFIPKGTWKAGLTVSYGEFSTADLQMLNLVGDVNVGVNTFNIKPYLSYFLRNNLALGVRMGYTRSSGNIDSFKVDIDEDMNFNLHDIGYRAESYTAAVMVQQYMGLSRRGRFGIYNEAELAFSSGNSDFDRPYAGAIKRTHTTNMEAKLTFSPGVCVFIMENVSFNVSFGVFGFYLRNEKQVVDGEPLGNRFTSGANFRINLFNLAFGLGIHL